MADTPTPFGKHLKSVATYLTRWVRSKPKPDVVEKKVQPIVLKTEPSIPESPKRRAVTSVATRANRAPAAKKEIAQKEEVIEEEPLPIEVKAETIEEKTEKNTEAATGILLSFPEGKNLVGQSVDMKVGGKTHNLIIRTDSLFLDAQKHIVSASGGALGADVELDILDCVRSGNTLTLKVGAFGKDATMLWTESEWEDVIEMLLRGKTCKCKTDRGQTLEIKRNNY